MEDIRKKTDNVSDEKSNKFERIIKRENAIKSRSSEEKNP